MKSLFYSMIIAFIFCIMGYVGWPIACLIWDFLGLGGSHSFPPFSTMFILFIIFSIVFWPFVEGTRNAINGTGPYADPNNPFTNSSTKSGTKNDNSNPDNY